VRKRSLRSSEEYPHSPENNVRGFETIKPCFVYDSLFQIDDVPIGLRVNGQYAWVAINQEIKVARFIRRHCRKQKLRGRVIEGSKAVGLGVRSKAVGLEVRSEVGLEVRSEAVGLEVVFFTPCCCLRHA